MKPLKSIPFVFTVVCVFVLGLILTGIIILQSCKQNKTKVIPKIIIRGSETELPLIANYGYEFQEQNAIDISVSGGGSNAGISDLFEQRIDIANSSRIITEEEKKI